MTDASTLPLARPLWTQFTTAEILQSTYKPLSPNHERDFASCFFRSHTQFAKSSLPSLRDDDEDDIRY